MARGVRREEFYKRTSVPQNEGQKWTNMHLGLLVVMRQWTWSHAEIGKWLGRSAQSCRLGLLKAKGGTKQKKTARREAVEKEIEKAMEKVAAMVGDGSVAPKQRKKTVAPKQQKKTAAPKQPKKKPASPEPEESPAINPEGTADFVGHYGGVFTNAYIKDDKPKTRERSDSELKAAQVLFGIANSPSPAPAPLVPLTSTPVASADIDAAVGRFRSFASWGNVNMTEPPVDGRAQEYRGNLGIVAPPVSEEVPEYSPQFARYSTPLRSTPFTPINK